MRQLAFSFILHPQICISHLTAQFGQSLKQTYPRCGTFYKTPVSVSIKSQCLAGGGWGEEFLDLKEINGEGNDSPPTPVFLPRKSHGLRSLVGYGPWGGERVRHDLVTKQQQETNPSYIIHEPQLHQNSKKEKPIENILGNFECGLISKLLLILLCVIMVGKHVKCHDLCSLFSNSLTINSHKLPYA